MSKRYDEPIEVEVMPVVFTWRGRRYPVDLLLKRWKESEMLWDPAAARDLECFRVQSHGGTYDLSLDFAGPRRPWHLMTVWD